MPKRSFPRCIASCCRGCRRAHIHRAAASTQTVRSFTLKLARWGPWFRTRGENRTARQTTSCGVCLYPQTSPSRHVAGPSSDLLQPLVQVALPGSVAPCGSSLVHSVTKLCLNCMRSVKTPLAVPQRAEDRSWSITSFPTSVFMVSPFSTNRVMRGRNHSIPVAVSLDKPLSGQAWFAWLTAVWSAYDYSDGSTLR